MELQNLEGGFPLPYAKIASGTMEDGRKFTVGVSVCNQAIYVFLPDSETYYASMESIISDVLELIPES